MILRGKLISESPIYRGNSRKTLFTRNGDGKERLVSLAGEISGTAQSLMDAFIGQSKNRRNIGLLWQLWQRLFGEPMPNALITSFECNLQNQHYPRDHFFDMRMGIKLNEDRGAAEANANYKLETILRHSVFDVKVQINDAVLKAGENEAKLYYLFEELKMGRFWFGAGKSKGLGRCRMELDAPFNPPSTLPATNSSANHLAIDCSFDLSNPVIVGWNWGRLDSEISTFAAIDGRLLLSSLLQLPESVRKRLEMSIGGPIHSPKDWKNKLAQFLPRAVALWLTFTGTQEKEVWTLPSRVVSKLGKGKYPVSKKILDPLNPLLDQPFDSREEATEALTKAVGEKNVKKAKRVFESLESEKQKGILWNSQGWSDLASKLSLEDDAEQRVSGLLENETELVRCLEKELKPGLTTLYQQIDRQLHLLQSDPWIDMEIANREEHLKIKTLLLQGKVDEHQWNDPALPPTGVKTTAWKEFLRDHQRVQFHHMMNPVNLRKSIINDKNFIDFLIHYRHCTRQELSQPLNTDFRSSGGSAPVISKKQGKHYDRLFMRMLSWRSDPENKNGWQLYIPGSTLKGAFRKRASQLLRTYFGDSSKTTDILNRLFGVQGQRGLVFFSDAYLSDPNVPEKAWCSMDSVKMNPATGKPVDEAKTDMLFVYDKELSFRFRLDLQDITGRDIEAISLLKYLIEDFQKGDIVFGGQKSNGFGWVKGVIEGTQWLTLKEDAVSQKLFGNLALQSSGFWQGATLEGDQAEQLIQGLPGALSLKATGPSTLKKMPEGFISHRAFGGYCGTLVVEGTVLTPLHIAESGEPSFSVSVDNKPLYGHDFFSISSPEKGLRSEKQKYTVPSSTLKGAIRHLYQIASDSKNGSPNINQLNPTDLMFGWVGVGPNQALAGRVVFEFGELENPSLAWFKVPYPYGMWHYNGRWENSPEKKASMVQIDKNWRLFVHTPVAPCVESLDSFQPDTPQASYVRALLPDNKFRFRIRFWNLEKEELQRLVWCVGLEEGLAHKLGKHRYLGLGSFRLNIVPESFLIDWSSSYNSADFHQDLEPNKWLNEKTISHYQDLKKVLDAKCI